MKNLVLVIAVLPLAAASAATITVNTTADNTTAGDGQCTLRQAIANVNASADTSGGDCAAGTGAGDAITFTLQLPATIRLALGELAVGQNVTITGPTAGALRISGRHATRVFEITAGTTDISDLTIQNGRAEDYGGGVLVDGGAALILTKCTLSRNRAVVGGGISNAGTATLANCTLSRNRALGGGGISNAGTATLTNCTLSRNRADEAGGITNAGTATLTNCTLSRNWSYVDGGGVANVGTATLTNCTLSRNRAYQGHGGGIFNGFGTTSLTNCTLSRNRAGSLGGGVVGTATLVNTIIGSNVPTNCLFTTSGGHNLSSDGTCFPTGGSDLTNTAPILAPLTNYGGPTQTLALCAGLGVPRASCVAASPAIDAGDDAVTGPPDNLTTDQRGLPRKAGLHVDIGAYEVQ